MFKIMKYLIKNMKNWKKKGFFQIKSKEIGKKNLNKELKRIITLQIHQTTEITLIDQIKLI